MDYNRQQRDQYGQQSGWGQQGRQQDQWQDGGEMDTNYNMRNVASPNPSYGETYHGNVQQREEETNRARGRNYGNQRGMQQGGMFQGGNQRYGQDYNPGGYGQVGNTGGGYGAWDSYGSSGSDMGGNYEGRRSEDWGSRSNAGNYGQQGGNFGNYERQGGGGYGQSFRGSSQNMGDKQQYGRNRRQDDDNDWWDRAKNEVRSWFNDDDDDRDDNRRRNYQWHEGAMTGDRRMVSDDRSSGDYRSRGEHWGKGPRGYQRSEDRIREDVCERLAYDGYVDASDIDVQVEGSEVILTGTVRSRAEKRRAEDLVESIMGVRNVENRIRVNQEQSSGSWQSAGSSRAYGDAGRSNTGSESNFQNRSYTGNTGEGTGIGNESGTTNEIIRNSGTTDTNL